MGWNLKKKFKKMVKNVARGVKKVAKKTAYAIPGGKKLWDFSSKVGKKAKKGIMKGMQKLGPVGVMAISAVLSATGIGAGIAAAMGSLWSSMGVAAAAAANAGGVLGALGTVANAAFTAVSWVGSSIGAVGDALAAGGKHLMSEGFTGAGQAFGKALSTSLTGSLKTAGVNQAAAKVAMDAGQGMWSQAVSAGSNALATSGGSLAGLGESFAEQAGTDVLSQAPVQGAWTTGADAVAGSQSAVPAAWAPTVTDALPAGPQSANLVGNFSVEKAAAKMAAPDFIDTAIKQGTEMAQEQGQAFIQKKARSLLAGKPSGQPAAGYQQAPNEYEDYYGPEGAAFADPTRGQAVTASQVGGVQQPNSYYNPNAFA